MIRGTIQSHLLMVMSESLRSGGRQGKLDLVMSTHNYAFVVRVGSHAHRRDKMR